MRRHPVHRLRLTPVVAILSLSPSQTTREPLTPEWPSATLTASVPARGSNRRSFLSLQVCTPQHDASTGHGKTMLTVARVVPTVFQHKL